MSEPSVDFIERIKSIQAQISELIVQSGGPVHHGHGCFNIANVGPVHFSSRNCLEVYAIHSSDDLTNALRNIEEWLGYIIEVLEPQK